MKYICIDIKEIHAPWELHSTLKPSHECHSLGMGGRARLKAFTFSPDAPGVNARYARAKHLNGQSSEAEGFIV